MSFDPLAWALGLVGRGIVNKVLESFSGDELTKALQELTSWAQELATEGIEIAPQALTDRLFSEVPEESPRRAELREALVRKNLPDAQVWFAALYERWEQVRQAVGDDAQEFFRLDPAEAEKHLRRLAQGFERACERNQQMFQHAVLQRLNDLTELVRSDRIADAGVAGARDAFVTYAKPLLNWPTTLHKTGDHIKRGQLKEIVDRIRDNESSTTIVLGLRGTGKSALLATVGVAAAEEGWTVFAMKADLMTESSDEEIERARLSASPRAGDAPAAAARVSTSFPSGRISRAVARCRHQATPAHRRNRLPPRRARTNERWRRRRAPA